jgi:alanyl-tRNA synthetase
VIQGKLSNYDTDLFTPILDAIGERAGRAYGASPDHPGDVSMRVIADHLRAMTFLISDGVVPSNEWRGYVLRKIMRRAMRHGKKLGFVEPVLHAIVPVLVREMADAYPQLIADQDNVVRIVRSEEERFDAVLTAGLPRLEDELDRVEAGSRVVPGDEAFRLYDSLGVPLDFMEDVASQRGIAIDREGFERAMKGQRERARAASSFKGGDKAFSVTMPPELEPRFTASPDEFAGYEATTLAGAPVIGVFDETGAWTTELTDGHEGYLALARTPFYLEAGGQVSDQGRIYGADGSEGIVQRMVRSGTGKPRLHQVRVTRGAFKLDQIVTAEVQDAVRDATRRNHTATHLLHAALRQVLGSHVKQAGSLVAPDRLRFDFAHFASITPAQLLEIERIVNEQIRRNAPVQTEVRSTEDAIAAGAMALFGEKYGDRVRVVSVPGFSLELCGGTHVRATGDIGYFVITAEAGVAAGVRRIEALTGAGGVEHSQHQRAVLESVVSLLNVPADQAADAVQRLQAEARRASREADQLKMKLALGGSGGGAAGPADDSREVNGIKLIARRVEGLEKSALRGLSDSLRDRLGSGVVVLASENDGKVALVVSVTKDLTSKVQAGRLVKELAPLVGGGGGGRPDFAEAGGKDPSGIELLLSRAPEVLKSQLQN